MTSRFLDFMPFIFTWEGGYDNDPDDPGGETKYGIDKRSHPNEDIKNLTHDRAEQIYWEQYWLPMHCDALPKPVGEVVFNIAVNCGASRAAKWLQQSIYSPSVVVDGRIGPKTIEGAKLFHDGPVALAQRLIDRTQDHYDSIGKGRLAKFHRGWTNRNNALVDFLAFS